MRLSLCGILHPLCLSQESRCVCFYLVCEFNRPFKSIKKNVLRFDWVKFKDLEGRVSDQERVMVKLSYSLKGVRSDTKEEEVTQVCRVLGPHHTHAHSH